MSHELDSTNGVFSFADSRRDAWHQLGQQVGHAMTAEEALREAHLADWNVRKEPLFVTPAPLLTDTGVTPLPPIEVPDRFALVRTNPINRSQVDYLSTVGTGYVPVQNEATAEVLDRIVSDSGAHYETAGAIYGGRQGFLSVLLPDAIEIEGHKGLIDRTELYLTGFFRHDGKGVNRFIITPVRVVCKNTQDFALKTAPTIFPIRHTANHKEVIAAAREALGITFKYSEEFEAECRKLFEREMTTAQMRAFTEELTGANDTSQTEKVRANRQEEASNIMWFWHNSETLESVKNTFLGAYNAVSERADHGIIVKGSDDANVDDAATARALKTITSIGDKHSLRRNAFRLLTKV